MKKLSAVLLFFCCISISLFAQNTPTLTWQISAVKKADGLYLLQASTTIPSGYYLYGNNATIDGLQGIQFLTEFENDSAIGSVKFLSTSNTIKDPLFENKSVAVFSGKVSLEQTLQIKGIVPASLKGTIEAFLGKTGELIPSSIPFSVALEGGVEAQKQKIILEKVDLKHPIVACGDNTNVKDTGFLKIFILGFLGGLIALLTPCVFPMIPVTVSFFTKRSNSTKGAIQNGFLYGLFIFLIYIAVSLPFHLLDNVQPEILNNVATNPWLNIIFFVIFIVFAISFFGYFEITLPSSFANKADSKGSLGSIGGIFFMALTLTIVSFSCTGPILGSLLVGTAGSGAWLLTSGLAGFGLALALPFGLFAIFPEWLSKLPKSGGWLDTVKKVLAFIEVALAFKFLSNADLVQHWGLLKREVFIGVWVIVGVLLSLYAFGFLRLPHDYKGMKISMGRKIVGVLACIFTLYLAPALTNTTYANLKLLSGFPPPFSYSVYGHKNVNLGVIEANVVNDYSKALAMAKAQKKPLLIDFTGWACVNCRKMEENVWTQPEVAKYIQDHFILVSLYVDDKQLLPITNRFTYTTKKGGTKDINSIGDLWSTFQTENFEKSSQPLYVILNNQEQLISHPVAYTPDYKTYLQWLQCSKQNFQP